jgi:ABC-2 type transport system ATP-binding protein
MASGGYASYWTTSAATMPGQRYVHPAIDATQFVRGLFGQYGDQVRRASLEDAYMALVQEFETGQGAQAAREFEEVGR